MYNIVVVKSEKFEHFKRRKDSERVIYTGAHTATSEHNALLGVIDIDVCYHNIHYRLAKGVVCKYSIMTLKRS